MSTANHNHTTSSVIGGASAVSTPATMSGKDGALADKTSGMETGAKVPEGGYVPSTGSTKTLVDHANTVGGEVAHQASGVMESVKGMMGGSKGSAAGPNIGSGTGTKSAVDKDLMDAPSDTSSEAGAGSRGAPGNSSSANTGLSTGGSSGSATGGGVKNSIMSAMGGGGSIMNALGGGGSTGGIGGNQLFGQPKGSEPEGTAANSLLTKYANETAPGENSA